MATCNASSLLTANPFTQLDPGLQDAVKLQLLCDISANGGGGGGGIGGSGTAGALAKFTAGTTLGDSLLSESGSTITLSGRQVITQGTITALAPALDVTTTWNNAAVTFTGLRYNVTDTASNAASLLLDLQVSGASRIQVVKTNEVRWYSGANFTSISSDGFTVSFNQGGIQRASINNAGLLNVTSAFSINGDCVIDRDAANTFAIRRTTNAQTFNIYNTYTSATNLERLAARWSSNVAWIDTQKGSGGGTARDLVLGTDSTERVRFDVNGNVIVNTAAIATNATNGFLYVPSCAGTPTGVPTTFTGRVPIVVDTTNNKLYFYSGAAWRDAGP